MTPANNKTRPSLRLSHLLLLITACAAWIAHYVASLQRQQAAEYLQQLAFAAELAPLIDPRQFQVTRADSSRHYASCRWITWVPYGSSAKIHWATHGLVQDGHPVISQELKLEPGRHTVHFLPAEPSKTVILKVDGDIVFERKMQRNWNIAAPWSTAMTSSPADSLSAPIDLLKAHGTARLRSEEQYDPALHQFGLHVWYGK